MNKRSRILNIIIQFITGFIVACGAFLLLGCFIKAFFPQDFLEDWHLILFVVMAIGSLSGIFLIDNVLFKARQYNVLGVIMGLLLGFLSLAFAEWILPLFFGVDMVPVYSFIGSTIIGDFLAEDGVKYVFFLPLTTALFSVIGYNLACCLSYHVLRRSKVLREPE